MAAESVTGQVWEEIAQELFEEKYELDMFFRLQKLGMVSGAIRAKFIRQLVKVGAPKAFAEKFIEKQFIDMQAQITEQREVQRAEVDKRMAETLKGAIMDPSGTYRYSLWRIWNPELPGVLFVMLNPSTADENIDDPTIRRCISFANAWGAGSLEVVNLFAYRATNPDELKLCTDPIGPDNDVHINRALERTTKVIAAWGTRGGLLNRNKTVMKMLDRKLPHCLDMTKDGHPKHPLYMAGSCEPFRYFGEAGI